MIKDFENISLRSAIWFYDIENFINDNGVAAPGTGMGSDCLYNIDHMKLHGFEVEASVRLGKRFRAMLSYTYQEQDAESTGFEEEWTYYLPALLPRHKVKLLAGYRLWKDGWLRLSSRYVGERKAQKGETLDEYVTIDLGFEQKFKLGKTEYSAAVYLNNAAGTGYEEQAGYEMPKHVWGFQLSMNY